MPTYDYACSSCGHRFETVQRMTDKPLRDCPKCDASEVKRVFSSVGIAFKGSGFYKTDSRSANGKSKKAESAESKSESAESKSKDSTSKDSKDSKSTKDSKSPSSSPGDSKSKDNKKTAESGAN